MHCAVLANTPKVLYWCKKMNLFPIPDGMNHLPLPPHPHFSLQRKLKLKPLFPSNKWKFMAEPEIKLGLPNACISYCKSSRTQP